MPHSNNGDFKLVVTERILDEIYVILLGPKIGTIKLSLSEVHEMDNFTQEYITSLLPKILSGVYDIKLTKELNE